MSDHPAPKQSPIKIRRSTPYPFEVRKKPRCEDCDILTNLVRRSAHPTLGEGFELHDFRCKRCGAVLQQDAAPKAAK